MRQRLTPKFLVGNSPEDAQNKFLQLQILNAATYTIISIYAVKDKVYIWYYDKREILGEP